MACGFNSTGNSCGNVNGTTCKHAGPLCHGIYLSPHWGGTFVALTNITIKGNFIYRNYDGAGITNNATSAYPDTNELIENNIFVDNGIDIYVPGGFKNSKIINNVLIHNNPEVMPPRFDGGATWYAGLVSGNWVTSSPVNVVENNIFYTSATSFHGLPIYIFYSTSATKTQNYDLWYVPANTRWIWGGVTKNDFLSSLNGTGYKATTGYDTNGVFPTFTSLQPIFLNGSGLLNAENDFKLKTGSPAINVGSNCPTQDYWLANRTGTCDIGVENH